MMMLQEHSRVGIGILPDVTVTDVPAAGAETEIATGDGTALQARLVGESFGFMAETLDIELEADATVAPPAGGTFETSDTIVAFAAKVGMAWGFSLGMEGAEEVETDNATGQSNTEEGSIISAGAVWRLSDVFSIGGTFGTETVEQTGGGTTVEGDRIVSRIGLGFYERDGEDGFHLEVFREGRGLLEIRDAGGNLITGEEEETVGATVEVVFSNILLGVEVLSVSTDVVDPFVTPNPHVEEEDETTISVGWVPETGLAIVLTLVSDEETSNVNADAEEIDATFVGFSWVF
ncbi:MAG: hypothetical protein GWN84_06435 [Gammaproteobacteria bacterium]|nr:hypothetical protein [Gammaproteobacteria bacterium]